MIYYIDLFSGAGGTTTGIHMAREGVKVVACVNHDTNAIESHKANHPDCLHFIEDVRDFAVIQALKKLVIKLRKEDPNCLIGIWASLECTNYSKAKGGQPRDADSRTLAHALYRKWSVKSQRFIKGPGYIQELKPDILDIENVREFMAWGPLDEKGRPISKLNGRDYLRWVKTIKKLGYNYDWRMLNSANFGAYTSRDRFFGKFTKQGLPIAWPEQTHAKEIKDNSLFKNLHKWKPVREVLDLSDKGRSIFTRNSRGDMPVENTLVRYLSGLVKYVANGDSSFLEKAYSGHPYSKVLSIEGPAHTITAADHHRLVQASFLAAYYGTGDNVSSINSPCPVVPTKDRFQKVQPTFMIDYQYKSSAHSINKPCPTVLTKDKFAKVDTQFFTNYYSGGGQHTDLNQPSPTIVGVPKQRLTSVLFMDQQYGKSKPHGLNRPVGTITANPKQNLINAQPFIASTNFNNIGTSINEPHPTVTANRKWSYLVNPSWFGATSSVDNPSPTIVARQDKAPLSVVNAEATERPFFAIPLFEDRESETMTKIRVFMALYYIVDITARMLKIPELKAIMGFPKDYVLKGSQTQQKKYIGNAVVPVVAKAIMDAQVEALTRYQIKKQAV